MRDLKSTLYATKTAPADGALDGEDKGKSLVALVMEVLTAGTGARWQTADQVGSIVCAMDRPLAKRATKQIIASVLSELAAGAQVQSRDEQGVVTYRSSRRRAN